MTGPRGVTNDINNLLKDANVKASTHPKDDFSNRKTFYFKMDDEF